MAAVRTSWSILTKGDCMLLLSHEATPSAFNPKSIRSQFPLNPRKQLKNNIFTRHQCRRIASTEWSLNMDWLVTGCSRNGQSPPFARLPSSQTSIDARAISSLLRPAERVAANAGGLNRSTFGGLNDPVQGTAPDVETAASSETRQSRTSAG